MSEQQTTHPDPIVSPKRLAAVRKAGLLDTAPEAEFDDLTRVAALVTGAPFAFATLVDDTRSFWKSCFGVLEGSLRQNAVDESFCQYVVRSQAEFVVIDAATDERTRSNPSVASMGVRAWAGFPLTSPDGEVLGSFCLMDLKPREWSERDLEVLRTLAHAASREIAVRSIANDERLARSRAEATTRALQGALLPPILPSVDDVDVAAVFYPAGTGEELGGDFYDVFKTREGAWNFVVGDVCGKGPEAAKIAAFARYAVIAAAAMDARPSSVLAWLNDTLISRSPHPDIFLTAVYGSIARNADGAAITMASAGHVPPLVRRADGTIETIRLKGLIAGILPEFSVEEAGLQLRPGDALVIATDGVHEARCEDTVFGERAVNELLTSIERDASARDIAEQIAQAALAFCDGNASDDIAVLVISLPR